MAPIIDCSLLESLTPWLQKGYIVLEDMISRGNIIARFRKSELEQLSGLLSQLPPDRPLQPDDPTGRGQQAGISAQISSPMPPPYPVPELLSLNDGLTTAEIMAVAESIDTGDVDWVARAVTENHIW
jgi:hypothetical protein